MVHSNTKVEVGPDEPYRLTMREKFLLRSLFTRIKHVFLESHEAYQRFFGQPARYMHPEGRAEDPRHLWEFSLAGGLTLGNDSYDHIWDAD